MASSIANIVKVPELRKRILFTLMMLAVYRVGVFITVPGANRAVMHKLVASGAGTFLGLFNMFSGGALEQFSIFALGIMPYVSAQIILQLLAVVVPALDRLQKEGQSGQKRIEQYTRYGTILLSVVQSFFMATWLQRSQVGEQVVVHPGPGFVILTVLTLTTGTAFIMWLGEQITERGISNGISLIIFAGIVAELPNAIARLWAKSEFSTPPGTLGLFDIAFILAIVLVVVAVICFFEQGQRRIPVQYAKRVVGRKMYGGQSTHLPLKVNMSGVIPPIFASSILVFPIQLANFINTSWMHKLANTLQVGDWQYNSVYIALVIFFCYFYTAVTFNPIDVADNMKKYGGYIPGIRPGKKTAEYIDHVLSRITFGGAIYISTVCVLPSFLQRQMGVPFYFGGTGLLIVVGVALDTVQQIKSHLITRHYESFTGPRGPRIRGRQAAIAPR